MNGVEPGEFDGKSHGRPASYPLTLGAQLVGENRCRFRVWASRADKVAVHLMGDDDRMIEMQPQPRGYFETTVDNVPAGSLYKFRLNGGDEFPDPASRFQPEGVHGPSQVVSSRFDWNDAGWGGLPLSQYVIYELHVGTFTEEGTFDAIIPHLDELRHLGITAIELMPLAQFPGDRNWGYDGVFPSAVQRSYGGPDGLRRLVDACHQRGLAVVIDVVYNHLGPEGNYLSAYGHYFTDRYHTPWGEALNFDGPHSDEVRRYFIENALYWVTDFHMDGLRLDAVHAIYDESAYAFLHELSDCVHQRADELNRRVQVIAESNLNDSRLVLPEELGGYGLDSQWTDDFHHALHTMFTGERDGYYVDFEGFGDLVTTFREGAVYSGRYSRFRKRRHGNSPEELPRASFVVCAQNHDQVGNRLYGNRLSEQIDFEQQKLAAGLVLLSPFVPLLFMGEEYGDPAPFQYFISHIDAKLVEAVRRGRREEFADFEWDQPPPDPQSEETFRRCKLNHALKKDGAHRVLWCYYQALLSLRRSQPALATLDKDAVEVDSNPEKKVMTVRRWTNGQELTTIFHCGGSPTKVSIPMPPGVWSKCFDSADERWNGPGRGPAERAESAGRVSLEFAPHSLAVYEMQQEH